MSVFLLFTLVFPFLVPFSVAKPPNGELCCEDCIFSDEHQVLIKLYKDLSANQTWKNSSGWLEFGVSHCAWFGIECNSRNQVEIINLSNNRLRGTVPSELLKLSFLKMLDLSQNQILGTFLDIPITRNSTTLTQGLQVLNLSGNQFEDLGEQFPTFFPQLEILNCSENYLTKLPSTFGDLKNLKQLDLSRNPQFKSFGFNLSNIEVLDLSQTGVVVQKNLFQFSNLTHLYLSGLKLQDFQAIKQAQWERLQVLDLSLSEFTGLPLTEDFCEVLSSTLVELNLKQTQLLQMEIFYFPFLEVLDLSRNPNLTLSFHLSTTPAQELTDLAQYLPSLKTLAVDESPTISNIQIQGLNALEEFRFSGQGLEKMNWPPNLKSVALTGKNILTLPESLGFLPLEELYIDSTQVGTFPDTFDRLSESLITFTWREGPMIEFPEFILKSPNNSSLQTLRLYNTRLKAPIPADIRNLKLLQDLDFYNLNAPGTLPTELGDLSELTSFSLTGVNISGSVPTELGRLQKLNSVTLYDISIDPVLSDQLGNSFNRAQTCSLMTRRSIPFSCTISRTSVPYNLFGSRVCSLTCSGRSLVGSWMNQESSCKPGVQPGQNWRTELLEFSPVQDNGSLPVSVQADSTSQCGAQTTRTLLLGELEVNSIHRLEENMSLSLTPSSSDSLLALLTNQTNLVITPNSKIYLLDLSMRIQSKLVRLPPSTARFIPVLCAGWPSPFPADSYQDISQLSCTSSGFSGFSLNILSVEQCPEFRFFVLVDLENSWLWVANTPVFQNSASCSKNSTFDFTFSVNFTQGWTCPDPQDLNSCEATCSDGIRLSTEACDDGNDNPGDGCSNCKIDDGWICVNPTTSRTSSCSEERIPQSTTSSSPILLPILLSVLGVFIIFLMGILLYMKRVYGQDPVLISEDDVEILKLLGSGNFGQVWLGLWRGTTQVAVKVLKQDLQVKKEELQAFKHEAQVFSKLPPHPNIVQFLGLVLCDNPTERTVSSPTEQAQVEYQNQDVMRSSDLQMEIGVSLPTPKLEEIVVEDPQKGKKKSGTVSTFRGQTKSLKIITEYLSGGDLVHWMHDNELGLCCEDEEIELTPDQYADQLQIVLQLSLGIAAGMDHLHKNQIVHRDLAARNILIQAMGAPKLQDSRGSAPTQKGRLVVVPKVSDFGLCSSTLFQIRIPVRWAAPEILANPENATGASDVWSYSILLYEILTGCWIQPYGWMSNREVRKYVLNGGELPLPSEFPSLYVSLIKSGLSRIPACRPTFFSIYKTLALQTVDGARMLEPDSLPTRDERPGTQWGGKVYRTQNPNSLFQNSSSTSGVEEDAP